MNKYLNNSLKPVEINEREKSKNQNISNKIVKIEKKECSKFEAKSYLFFATHLPIVH